MQNTIKDNCEDKVRARTSEASPPRRGAESSELIKKVYQIQKWILVILLSSSALIFNPWLTTDVFEFPKVLIFLFATGLLTIINIIDLHLNGLPKTDFKNIKKELFCLGLLFITQATAYIFSTNQEISLMGEPLRFQGFLTNIQYIFLTLNCFYFFLKYPEEKTNNLFKWLIITLLIVCLLAIIPYFLPLTFPFYFFTPAFYFDRVYGTFGNPNYLAVFIIGALPFLIFLKNLRRFFLYPAITLCLITLFLTGSRSAWISSIIAFIITAILIAIKTKSYKYLIICGSIILFSLSAISLKNQLTPIIPQFERLTLDTEKSTSIKTRIYLWKAGLKMSLARPLTGYGQDTIQEHIEPYLPEYLKENEEFFVDRTHSEFIDILVTIGFFGLFAYVTLLALILFKISKLLQPHHQLPTSNTLPAFTSLLSLTIFHGVNFSITSSNILLYFLLGYLLAEITKVKPDRTSPS